MSKVIKIFKSNIPNVLEEKGCIEYMSQLKSIQKCHSCDYFSAYFTQPKDNNMNREKFEKGMSVRREVLGAAKEEIDDWTE